MKLELIHNISGPEANTAKPCFIGYLLVVVADFYVGFMRLSDNRMKPHYLT